jgi:phosphoglycerate dehydrogenase-like enzyme
MTNQRSPLSKVVIAIGEDDSAIAPFRESFPDIAFEHATSDTLNTRIVDAEAALIGWGSASGIFDHARKLVWIQNVGAGVERIVSDEFRTREIVLTNGSGIMAPNMAEHVIGLMLAFARRLPELFDAQREMRWQTGVDRGAVSELSGQTAVLVGLGDIGLAVARRLKAFDMTILGVRRSSGDDLPDHVDNLVQIADLDGVLPSADHVISSVPHTEETVGMFDAARFAKFKDGARFYNVGRGTSVIQPDLVSALISGKLSGAGLDVTDPEPLPAGDPLWRAPNVIITGHTSGATPKFEERLFALFGENIRRYVNGEELLNVVDQVRGY